MTPQFIATQIKFWNKRAKYLRDQGLPEESIQAERAATAYRYIRELQRDIQKTQAILRRLV